MPRVKNQSATPVSVTGSIAAPESDQAGSGNGTATFSSATAFVDVWNGGAAVLTIASGGITRRVPPGGAALCAFPTAAAAFTITADGDWIARAMS